MKVTELRIANFRCFKEATLRVAPVTLITGANSAGKSSLVAPLLAYAQTDGMPALLSPNGHHVEMGGFKEMVHGRRKTLRVGFDAEASSRLDSRFTVNAVFGKNPASSGLRLRDLKIVGSYYKMILSSTGDNYEMTYRIKPSDSRTLRGLKEIRQLPEEAEARPDSSDSETMLTAVATFLEATVDQLQLNARDVDSERKPLDVVDDNMPSEGKIDVASADELFKVIYSTTDLMESLVSFHISNLTRQMRRRLTFVSSFRLAPERAYYEVSKADLKVGRHGQNYVEQIAQWTSVNAPEIASLREDLAELGVLCDLEIGRLGAGRMELKGRPKPKSPLTNLADLGFGTSQLLPVLVAINQMTVGGVFVVAQPETHLHPEAQARLASYFVRLAKERNITFIVETHSEYLINRLRRLVAEGAVGEDEVSVAHLTNNGQESTVHPIQLRMDGQIVGAPEDFFETYMMDVMQLAMGPDRIEAEA